MSISVAMLENRPVAWHSIVYRVASSGYNQGYNSHLKSVPGSNYKKAHLYDVPLQRA